MIYHVHGMGLRAVERFSGKLRCDPDGRLCDLSWGEELPGKERARIRQIYGAKIRGRCISPARQRLLDRLAEVLCCLSCGINYAVNQQMSAGLSRLNPPSGKGDLIRLMYGLGLGAL